jgi:uncharacterized membrane-anchored protein YhcB (DUF1043 family)
MVAEAYWPAVILGVVIALVLGFLIGRYAGGPRKKADQLAAELEQQKEAAAEYRKAVDRHFDETATLFVSMAGSYKALFQHLSSGYEKLSDGSARDLFGERVHSMLLGAEAEQAKLAEAAAGDGRREPVSGDEAAATADADAAVATDSGAGDAAPSMPEGEPVVEPTPVEEPVIPEAERREKDRG